MILRCTSVQDSADERELRHWLSTHIGSEDESVLTRWVWENHHGVPSQYVAALALIVRGTAEKGVQFAQNLVAVAKKPREVVELEREILEFIAPLLKAAANRARAGKQGPSKEFEDLCWALQEKLRSLFPHVHRATMKGAMVASFVKTDRVFELNVAKLVEHLRREDPLATTASMSWG